MGGRERTGPPEIPAEVARDLLARRLKLRLTQKHLGALAGVGQSAVSRAEAGRGWPKVVRRLKEVLDAVEQQRHHVAHTHTDAFWDAATALPHGEEIMTRISDVAALLLSGSFAEATLGDRLLACLPDRIRRCLIDAAGQGDVSPQR